MKDKIPKPRNEFVAKMRLRPSGPHGKTKKAIRKAEKQKFKKGYENE